MKLISTRGRAQPLNFAEATLAGLADDGGLYLPQTWPAFSKDALLRMRDLSYAELAGRVLSPLVGDCIGRADLQKLIDAAYDNFTRNAGDDIAPLKKLEADLYLLELFHGPTFAFKDFALQFLGRLFDYLLRRQNQTCTIIGATSGDTGSAAIEAVRGLSAVRLFMLHPHARISDVQRKQMTTVDADNICNIAVHGTFDDCQNLVKAMFNDQAFRRRHQLAAVNSINWARIAAQCVYYFYAALKLGAPERAVNFAVPTGNFGNVFAGYAARRMRLPINRLIIGTNSNDILARFFQNGKMQKREVRPTLSPSMDIQISSNFERFLFELVDRDAEALRAMMRAFDARGEFAVDAAAHARANEIFCAHMLSDADTRAELLRVHQACGEIIDPHSAVGVAAARRHAQSGAPTVVLGTAHPAKFGDAVSDAIGAPPAPPQAFNAMLSRREKLIEVENDLRAVTALVDAA